MHDVSAGCADHRSRQLDWFCPVARRQSRSARLDSALQRQESRRLGPQDHRLPARRKLRRHLPRRQRRLAGVGTSKYTTFESKFGHLFYERQKFSYYIVAAEYRFIGEQVAGGPDWAIRNNGLMLHSQSPQSMWKDQDFPISVEVQLLGGLPNGKPRSTANMCSPGTQVFINGTMVKGHCLNSKSQTYAGDQWVRVEVEVRGGERLIHKVEGQTVLEYEKPTIGGGEVNKFDPAVKVDGTLLTDGYIAIQGESHPTEFRKIEVLNLSGCMDSKSPKYKSYYVHQGDGACK